MLYSVSPAVTAEASNRVKIPVSKHFAPLKRERNLKGDTVADPDKTIPGKRNIIPFFIMLRTVFYNDLRKSSMPPDGCLATVSINSDHSAIFSKAIASKTLSDNHYNSCLPSGNLSGSFLSKDLYFLFKFATYYLLSNVLTLDSSF